mgnify:CR=1 FL=1
MILLPNYRMHFPIVVSLGDKVRLAPGWLAGDSFKSGR